MKSKALLFLLAAAFLPPALRGQTLPFATLMLETSPTLDKGGIIRSWTPTKAVIYHEQFGSGLPVGYFSIIDSATTTMASVKFHDNIHVHDFRILGDSLYFGGTVTSGNDGVLGFFSLRDLEGMRLQSVTVFRDSDDMQQVRRVAAYRIDNGSGVGVAAIGWREEEDTLDLDEEYDSLVLVGVTFAIELTIRSGQPACQYKEVLSHRIGFNSETLDDVVVTDSYVAFVGDSAMSDIRIRRGDRDGFLSGTEFDSRHRYTLSSFWPANRPVAAAMRGDTIAVARTGYIGTSMNAAVYMFDLSNMAMYEAQKIPCGAKDCCDDMAYMEKYNTLLLLMETYDSAVTQQTDKIVYIVPGQPLPGLAPAISPSDGSPMSCVSVHDGRYVLAGSPNRWLLHRKCSLVSSLPCLNVDHRVVEEFDLGIYHKWEKSLPQGSLNPSSLNVSPTTESYHATCIHR